MARPRRSWVSQAVGSYHIISRIARNDVYFSDEEKEQFLKLLEKYSWGFFVSVHAFAVLGSHFHLLVTGLEEDSQSASDLELMARYKLIFGKMAEPPVGREEESGIVIPDEDGGMDRLRERLGSVSRFVQELKQSFSQWYNKRHGRKGYLWADRFKGVIVEKGEAQLVCSAYIDLNAVRAGLVDRPEDYRWSSMGLRARDKKRTRALLRPIAVEAIGDINDEEEFPEFYREFVYRSGALVKENKGQIPKEIVDQVIRVHGKLGLGESLRYRLRNLSEGVALGKAVFVNQVQTYLNRVIITPRPIGASEQLFATRRLLDAR